MTSEYGSLGIAGPASPAGEVDWSSTASGIDPYGRPAPMAGFIAPGMTWPGNIDLNKRPRVRNADGSISTVRSIGIDVDGKSYLIPTVVGDRVVSNQEAIDHFMRTGQHLGQFENSDAADAYAEWLHNQQADMVQNAGGIFDPNAYEAPFQPGGEYGGGYIAPPVQPGGLGRVLMAPVQAAAGAGIAAWENVGAPALDWANQHGLQDISGNEALGNAISRYLGEEPGPGTLGYAIRQRAGLSLPTIPGFAGRNSGSRIRQALASSPGGEVAARTFDYSVPIPGNSARIAFGAAAGGQLGRGAAQALGGNETAQAIGELAGTLIGPGAVEGLANVTRGRVPGMLGIETDPMAEVAALKAKIAKEGMTPENQAAQDDLLRRLSGAFENATPEWQQPPPPVTPGSTGERIGKAIRAGQLNQVVTDSLSNARRRLPPVEAAQTLWADITSLSNAERAAEQRGMDVAEATTPIVERIRQYITPEAAASVRQRIENDVKQWEAGNISIGFGGTQAARDAAAADSFRRSLAALDRVAPIDVTGEGGLANVLPSGRNQPVAQAEGIMARAKRIAREEQDWLDELATQGKTPIVNPMYRAVAESQGDLGGRMNLIRKKVTDGKSLTRTEIGLLEDWWGKNPGLQSRIIPGLSPASATGAVLGAATGYGTAPEGSTTEQRLGRAAIGAAVGATGGIVKDAGLQRTLQVVSDIGNIPRTLMSSMDLSGSLRQGGFLAPSHYREWKSAMGAQLRALASEENAQAIQREIETSPMAQYRNGTSLSLTKWDGTDLANREEQFMSSIAGNLPGVKQTSRAYTVMLNKLRADVFDNIAAKWSDAERTPQRLETLAKFVNASTGRGTLPESMRDIAPALNAAFFSPRFLLSIPQRHAFAFTSDPLIRNEAIKSLAGFYGTGLTILGSLTAAKSAGLLPGISIEAKDFNSPDWGKIKVGDTRYDIWGGHQQFARMMARVISSSPRAFDAMLAGKDVKPGDNPVNIATQYLRYKFSPVANLEEQLRTGQGVVGKAPSAQESAIRMVTPLFLQDMWDAYHAGGVGAAVPVSIGDLIGVGSNTYAPSGGTGRATAPAARPGGLPAVPSIPRPPALPRPR